MPPLGFLIVLLALAAFGVYSWRQDQKRREALMAWAASRRWRFMRHGVEGLRSSYPGVKLFDRGHSRSNGNAVNGELEGHPVLCLDYKYVTGSGKNRSTHRFGVVILETGFPAIPLQIRRENPLDKVGEFFGKDDIDFESAEFSRRFHVTSADHRWAYDIIHARTMEYLMDAPPVAIEFGFGEIAIYRSGRNAPADHETCLVVARKLLEMVPDYVVKQMRGETATGSERT